LIRHVVLCKLKENAPFDEIKTKIENLKNFIPEIKHIEVGADIGYDKNASDFCIITELEDEKGLDIYAKHPKHLEVIEFLKQFLTERRAVDYYVQKS
jgi:phage terminase large subunit